MTLFLVFLLVLFLIWRSVKRYQKLFNPFTLSIQIPLLFLIIPQLILIMIAEGEDSLLSDSVIAIFVLSIYWGTFLKLPYIKVVPFRNRSLLIKFTFLLIIVLSIPLLPILLSFGLSFSGLRNFYEYIVFSSYASFYDVVKMLILFLIVFSFAKNRKLTLYSFCLIVILFFSGSKMAILTTSIIIATLWEEYAKLNYKYLLLCFCCIAVFLIIYHYSQSVVTEDINMFETALSYFDVYRQQTLALDLLVSGKIDFFCGEISLSSWYKIIPRFFWEDKPKDFGFALLNYKIYPEYAADGYMPSFGLAYTFADFGFLSIISSGIFAGMLKNYFYSLFYKYSKGVVTCFLYLMDINIVLIILFTCYYIISNIQKNDT